MNQAIAQPQTETLETVSPLRYEFEYAQASYWDAQAELREEADYIQEAHDEHRAWMTSPEGIAEDRHLMRTIIVPLGDSFEDSWASVMPVAVLGELTF